MAGPAERMHPRANCHAHWRILASLKLKFVGEFQGEKFINMVESLIIIKASNEESASNSKGDDDVPAYF
jgi:hypothetical protein